MHGTLCAELQRFVSERWDEARWSAIKTAANVDRAEYDPLGTYPDEEFMALGRATAELTGTPSGRLLRDFGTFVGPALIRLYWGAVQPQWRTLDLIENTENTIHRVVRLNNPDASPPQLVARRIADDLVEITYKSKRRMCDLAKGIAAGVAALYEERIEIDDRSCMLRDDPVCRFVIRLVGDNRK